MLEKAEFTDAISISVIRVQEYIPFSNMYKRVLHVCKFTYPLCVVEKRIKLGDRLHKKNQVNVTSGATRKGFIPKLRSKGRSRVPSGNLVTNPFVSFQKELLTIHPINQQFKFKRYKCYTLKQF